MTAVTGDVEETDPGDLEVITNAIKQVGINAGSTLVGVAAADAFNEYVPEGHRPGDFLPGAQSVVVCASLGPTNAAWQSPNRRLMEITGYDFRENVSSIVVAEYIEQNHGYLAMQAPALISATSPQPSLDLILSSIPSKSCGDLSAEIINCLF